MPWALLNWFPSRKVACQTIYPYHCILAFYREKGRFYWKIIMHRYRLYSYQYFIQKIFLLGCTHHKKFNSFCRVEIYGQPCTIVHAVNVDKKKQHAVEERLPRWTLQIHRFQTSLDCTPPVNVSSLVLGNGQSNEYNIQYS